MTLPTLEALWARTADVAHRYRPYGPWLGAELT
jgi:hypothetical protein